MKGNASELPLTTLQKIQYAKIFGLTPKAKQEIAAAIFQDEVRKFMLKHSIRNLDFERLSGIETFEQIPFTTENVEKVCKALSELAGVEFENSFNNLKS